jgi:hypothetical protein
LKTKTPDHDNHVVNGTSYDPRTPDEVMAVLEAARQNRIRLHLSLGFNDGPNAGMDWLEEFETYGYIGRSTGPIKVPLLIANRRSLGGGAILDHCIVRIRESAGGKVLYQHPKYHTGTLETRFKAAKTTLSDGRILSVEVIRDGQVHAAFENPSQARRYLQKLGVVAPLV